MLKVAFFLETDRGISKVDVNTLECERVTVGNKVGQSLIVLD